MNNNTVAPDLKETPTSGYSSSDRLCEEMRRLKPYLGLSGRWQKRLCYYLLRIVIFAIGCFFVIVPLAIYLFPGIERIFIFVTFVTWPWFVDLTRPDIVGMKGTRNFYIETEENIILGAWHILPRSLADTRDTSRSFYELSLRKGYPVILYLHGNAGTRAGYHRLELYSVLQNLDAHVIAVDYRGFADSSPVKPTENGVVRDSRVVYKWIKERIGSSQLFVWGHSLGTGIGCRLVSELCQEGDLPKGLILEAPFNNMSEELMNHPMGRLLNRIPWFRWVALRALRTNKMLFESDKHISGITIPIVIFHARDDPVIPVKLGIKLHEAALDGRPKTAPPASLIVFDGEHKYGHVYICRAPDLPHYVRQFLDHPEIKIIQM